MPRLQPERLLDRQIFNMDQPLFGETRRRDKVINIVIALVTGIIVGLTVVMALMSSLLTGHDKCCRIYDRKKPFCVYGVDIVMCFIIILLLAPQIVVAYWYRRGELEPKFRTLIYYNAIVTIILCIVANLYFFQVGFHKPDCPN